MSAEDERDPLLAALEDDSGEAENATPVDPEREKALEDFKKKLKDHREWDAKLKNVRLNIRDLDKEYEKTEDVSVFYATCFVKVAIDFSRYVLLFFIVY